MSGDNGNNNNPGDGDPAPPPSPSPNPNPPPGDVLPQWARDQITRGNEQAAQYRINARDAQQAAEQSNTALNTLQTDHQQLQETNTTLTTERDSSRLDNLKLQAAINAEVPTAQITTFSGLLQGTTEDELKAHAEQVKQLFNTGSASGAPPRATDPSQGRNSDQAPVEPGPGLDRLRYAYSNKK